MGLTHATGVVLCSEILPTPPSFPLKFASKFFPNLYPLLLVMTLLEDNYMMSYRHRDGLVGGSMIALP